MEYVLRNTGNVRLGSVSVDTTAAGGLTCSNALGMVGTVLEVGIDLFCR